MKEEGRIVKISGPVVVAENVPRASMYDVVRVGEIGLVGEIIRIEGNLSTVQVYEDTSGIRPGERVINTHRPLSVELGPGLLSSIYDGIQRPLDIIREQSGDFIRRGTVAPPLDHKKKWSFEPTVKEGDEVSEGDVIGTVEETELIQHKIMVPFGLKGRIVKISGGDFTVDETVATLETADGIRDLKLMQEWPVRQPRRVKRKLPPEEPLLTGQRVIDTFFPVAKGGTVAVPGPFGSGKCVTGDTPVLLQDGSQINIEELYEGLKPSAKVVSQGDEEYLFLSEPIGLYSFFGGKIVESTSSLMYRGRSSVVVRIRTESGREVRVTPVHKLFSMDDAGSIAERAASDLKIGDSIVIVTDSTTLNSKGSLLQGEELSLFTGTSTEVSTIAETLRVEKDPIVDISVEYGDFDVYDVSVPNRGRNFVGGYGGILLHNTVVQHQLSKWADSDIVVYVGCGERGNEMTEILTTFPELQDPKSGRPLMERTVLIANTSNMPVAAREASVYTGITIAEYYRDMGYHIALMADSTSRWAEALREISGRLEEMPGEEGYPAYLGRRLSEFYERAGYSEIVASEPRYGSITLVGAVSPPGGDISEPVSQNTLRVTRVFWALDASLASRRHFPSINWLNSYSLYREDMNPWYRENISRKWEEQYSEAMGILQKEAELQEIVQLVGYDALPEREKAILDIARIIREDFLQQSAFDEVDTYCSINKQFLMLSAILSLGRKQAAAVESGVTMTQLQDVRVRTKISRMKEIRDEEFQAYYDGILEDIENEISAIMKEGGEVARS